MKRRSFLQAFGGSVLSARQIAENAVKNAGLSLGSGMPNGSLAEELKHGGNNPAGAYGEIQDEGWFNWKVLREKALDAALKDKNNRDEIESILYKRYRNHNYLDPDLAYNKCYSMAARLCYQRQRLVENELNKGLDSSYADYQAVDGWKSKILGKLGLLNYLK